MYETDCLYGGGFYQLENVKMRSLNPRYPRGLNCSVGSISAMNLSRQFMGDNLSKSRQDDDLVLHDVEATDESNFFCDISILIEAIDNYEDLQSLRQIFEIKTTNYESVKS